MFDRLRFPLGKPLTSFVYMTTHQIVTSGGGNMHYMGDFWATALRQEDVYLPALRIPFDLLERNAVAPYQPIFY